MVRNILEWRKSKKNILSGLNYYTLDIKDVLFTSVFSLFD